MADNTHDLLQKIVNETQSFPGWSFELADEGGSKVLRIIIETEDNYRPGHPFVVCHPHPVPMATYNEKTWQRWIFDQCMRSMTHELGESLTFGRKRPFAPCHGPGEDPYILHDNRSDEERRTMQDGSIRPKPAARSEQL